MILSGEAWHEINKKETKECIICSLIFEGLKRTKMCSNKCRSINRREYYGVEYGSWKAMINRCTNKGRRNYYNYGGRGIIVCEEWLDMKGYRQFKKDMGPRPEGYTLDRIDNDKNYEPSNCRWVTMKEQRSNQRDFRAPLNCIWCETPFRGFSFSKYCHGNCKAAHWRAKQRSASDKSVALI